MAKKDDCLGLSLSLRCPENLNPDPLPPPPATLTAAEAPFPLNLFRSPSPFMQLQKISRTDAFQTASARQADPGTFLGGIDINRTLNVVECDEAEEVMVTSPNSTVSSISGKRSEREENDGERAASCSMEIEEDGGDAASRKKLRLSKEQAAVLVETFKEHSTLNPKQKMGLAKQLNLRPRQVEVWFQNRRARFVITDEVEANRGGLRVLETLLPQFDGGKQAIAKGSERPSSSEALPAILRSLCVPGASMWLQQPPAANRPSRDQSSQLIVIEEGACRYMRHFVIKKIDELKVYIIKLCDGTNWFISFGFEIYIVA